jgi:cytochrome P450
MWVAASTMDIHTDERFYSEGQSYQPFRFVEEQTTEDGTSPSKETKTQDTGMPTQKVTKVATKSTYLPFGTGRHAW